MATLKHSLDPFAISGVEPPRRGANAIRKEVADYILEEVLNRVGDGRSPVAGGKWKRGLSKEYKQRKLEESGVGFANMELEGDMLDALRTRVMSDGTVELIIEGSEGDKADGHNNFSGKSRLPLREFIPKPGQSLKRDIVEGIREIVRSNARD